MCRVGRAAAKIFASPQFSPQKRGEGDDGQQLTAAQIRVHDLDPDGILRQLVAEIGDGSSPDLQRPN